MSLAASIAISMSACATLLPTLGLMYRAPVGRKPEELLVSFVKFTNDYACCLIRANPNAVASSSSESPDPYRQVPRATRHSFLDARLCYIAVTSPVQATHNCQHAFHYIKYSCSAAVKAYAVLGGTASRIPQHTCSPNVDSAFTRAEDAAVLGGF